MILQSPCPSSETAPEFDLLAGDFRAHYVSPVESSWLAGICAPLVDICHQAAWLFECGRRGLFDWQRGIGQPISADRVQGIVADLARWQRNPRAAKVPRPLKRAPAWPWSECRAAFRAFAPPELHETSARSIDERQQDGTAAAAAVAAFALFLDACEDVNRSAFDDEGPAAPPAPPAVFCHFAAMEYSRRAAEVACELAELPRTIEQPATFFLAIQRAAELVASARVALGRAETERTRAEVNAIWCALSLGGEVPRHRGKLRQADATRAAVFAALAHELGVQPGAVNRTAIREDVAARAGCSAAKVSAIFAEPAALWPDESRAVWDALRADFKVRPRAARRPR